MTEALDTTDARFVEAFVRTGSAPEACEAAGISPRKAKQMMGNPDIQRAIAARTAPSDSEKPADAVSLDSLIADARAAALTPDSGRPPSGFVAFCDETSVSLTHSATLDADDARFVAEFMVDRNPAAACQRAGLSPRKARQMLANPDIIAEIARRQAPADSGSAAGEVSLATLIAQAQEAYAVAKRTDNSAGMNAATQTLARLTGRMDGDAPELSDQIAAPLDSRDASRAVIQLLQDAASAEGWQIGFCGPDERLIRVPASLAHTVGGAPAYAMPPGDDQPVNELTPAEPPSDSELARAIAAALGPNALAVLEAATQSNGAGNRLDGTTPAPGSVSPLSEPAPFSGERHDAAP